MTAFDFSHRLSEAIAWCSLQELISDPSEDIDIERRREIARQAAEMSAEAYNIFWRHEKESWFWRWTHASELRRASELRGKAEKLRAVADPASIAPPLRRQLRSEALRPTAGSLGLSRGDADEVVKQVVEARSRILGESGTAAEAEIFDMRGGRLLLYAPDENVSDGASEYASLGFFDGNDAPPWDVWVAMFGRRLVSWVPAALLKLAEDGIAANAVECMRWADSGILQELDRSSGQTTQSNGHF